VGTLRLEEIAAVVKPRGIPIMVDAASEHLERPSPWLVRGADLVVYSGGKFLRGPQTSGLLLGSKQLVQAAWSNASPHQALGRPMKVSKEDIVGVLTAVEHWFEDRDHAAEQQRWYDDLEVIGERLGEVHGAALELIDPAGVDRVPRLRVSWDRWQYPLDGLALRQRVLDGEPRIMLDDNSATENSIAIDPFQLQPGEAAQVGNAIASALREASRHAPAPARPPETEIAGNWELTVDFLQGSRVHRLNLEQRGPELGGHQRSTHFEGPVSGWLNGDQIQLSFTSRYEGSTICYFFDGEIHDQKMSGTAMLGAASDQNHGIVNRSQFGPGRWQASRVG
jgi:L-seryl-tRNA(Ser) seleniumtransferase